MMDLYTLAVRSGAPRQRLAELLGVSSTTLDRYLREDRCPESVARLLEIYAGRMPWPGCERFTYIRGAIYYRDEPEGLPVDEIPAYRFRLRLIDSLERELHRYRRAPAQFYLDFNGP